MGFYKSPPGVFGGKIRGFGGAASPPRAPPDCHRVTGGEGTPGGVLGGIYRVGEGRSTYIFIGFVFVFVFFLGWKRGNSQQSASVQLPACPGGHSRPEFPGKSPGIVGEGGGNPGPAHPPPRAKGGRGLRSLCRGWQCRGVPAGPGPGGGRGGRGQRGHRPPPASAAAASERLPGP